VETIGSGVGAPPPVEDPGAMASQVLGRDFALDIRSCLRRGWALVKGDFWPIVGINALILALLAAAGSLAAGGARDAFWVGPSALAVLLNGPFMGGLYLFYLKKLRGESAGVETAFSGFSNRFLHLFLGSFVTSTLTWLGFLCLVLPGIYLAVAWFFTLALIIDKRIDFWPAMNVSLRVVTKHWWKFAVALIAFGLVGVSGVLACGVGIFITMPIAMAAVMCAYEDVFGTVPAPASSPTAEAGPGGTVVLPGSATGGAGLGWKPTKPVLGGLAVLALVVALLALISTHAPRGHLRVPRPKRSIAVQQQDAAANSAVAEASHALDTASSAFGSVTERVVTEAINFGSGNLISVPDSPTNNADAGEKLARNIRQLELLGVDAYAEGQPPKLYALGMTLATLSEEEWDNATPEQVQAALASATTNEAPLVRMEAEDGAGALYAFKTREGSAGMLQVMGLAEGAPGVKIRYKLLKNATDAARADDFLARLQAAKTINSNPSRDNALALLAKDAAKAGQVAIVRESLGQINNAVTGDNAARESARLLAKRGLRRQAIEIAHTIHNAVIHDQAMAELAR
jgi:uncharacterized membrane protein